MGTDGTPEAIFGARLRAIREDRRLTQVDLGERLRQVGVSLHQTQIARIERGQRALRLNEAMALARALGTPLPDLLEPSQDDDAAEPGDPLEIRTEIEEQRRILTMLYIAAGEARKRADQTRLAKDRATADLDRAKDRLAAVSSLHQEAVAAYEEAVRRRTAVDKTMAELATRLELALESDHESPKTEELGHDNRHLPQTASDDPEVSVPYADTMISIRVEKTGHEKWNYVIVSNSGAELVRSGDYSSLDRARHARELVKHQILGKKRTIEEIGS